jgi:hypothetical protein
VVKEIRTQAKEDRPLAVAGAHELAEALRRELRKGGVESAVRGETSLPGAAALVYVLAGAPDQNDLDVLKRAARAHTPIVAVVAAPRGEHVVDPPYVLAEHVVTVQPGSGFPMDAIARALAHALNESATPIAARLPVLRDAVVDRIITRFARQNGVIGVSVFVPGADMPILTVNQIRMLMRIADAYGFEFDKERIRRGAGRRLAAGHRVPDRWADGRGLRLRHRDRRRGPRRGRRLPDRGQESRRGAALDVDHRRPVRLVLGLRAGHLDVV